ncbi:prepilin-type N-terminal cleavage/methylation domain-containing protein [Ferrovibrio sp.]|uniref:prepilin-type N-terminal cleavage/methylation domain-containing protein n=1 Tax=Ferrovibrio sp. TaxID=1917215 RepID=UPI0025BFAB3C|nr:prepilin-type N-terminal cleavage/methylation domain-containing protein [Ferrovibrio sp.]MBX3456028.1 prepilin-type N-terminal cleavage/methylation domain-containing protein [Ferrovibrio sp.]
MKQHGSQAGFSLIEALVALAAVAMVLGVALQQARVTLNAARKAERQSVALLLAESKLSELALRQDWRPGEEQGEESGLRWQLSLQPREGSALLDGPRLWQVSVTVRDAANDANIALSSLRLVERRP